mgnify:CR=1 FL=1
MARTVAIVGAGQIGYAAARRFFAAGWDVTVHARSRPKWSRFAEHWRAYDRGNSPPPLADCVIDTIAFDASDVAAYEPGAVGRLIVVSSASVYRDASGRTLDEGRLGGYPEFPGPVCEDHPTVAPGPATYSTRKIQMEQASLARFGAKATILRPCAIYGPWTRHPREWWFVKRLLDGRTRIPLIHNGTSRFQPTDVEKIAATALAAAEQQAGGVFNIADSDCPSVLEIGTTIFACLGREATFMPVAGEGVIGRSPWSIPGTFAIDGRKAMRLVEAGEDATYADHVGPAVSWLADAPPTDWRAAFPQLAAYPWDMFDYAAEDRFLEGR